MPSGTKVTLKEKRRIAELLASGLTYRETAGAVGRGEQTVTRLMQNPDFRAHVEQLKTVKLRPSPYDVLEAAMTSDKEETRLRAAVAYLQHAKERATDDDWRPPPGVVTFYQDDVLAKLPPEDDDAED